jgi:hypothetical protein
MYMKVGMNQEDNLLILLPRIIGGKSVDQKTCVKSHFLWLIFSHDPIPRERRKLCAIMFSTKF